MDYFYQLKRRLCNTFKPDCVRAPATGTSINACSSCLSIMADIQRVASWGVGRTAFGTRPHLFRALDDICLSLPVRYPLEGRLSILESCTELIDEYSTTIVDAVAHALTKPITGEADPAKIVCFQKAKRMYDAGYMSCHDSTAPIDGTLTD